MKTAITVTFSPAWWEQRYYSDPSRRVDTRTVKGRRADCLARDAFLRERESAPPDARESRVRLPQDADSVSGYYGPDFAGISSVLALSSSNLC